MKYTYISVLFFIVSQAITASDLEVTYKEDTIATVSRDEFMVEFFDDPVIDEEKYAQLIEKLDKKIYQEPIDATIDDNGTIISGKVGYKLNQLKFKELFYTYFFNNESTKIEVPILKVHPNVDRELLANIRTQKIGEYTTYYNTNNKERSHNIDLASEAINSHVVFPGRTFSFNQVVGKRTKEKGYMRAPVIVKGEVTEGIGGGICQVSSTLYNAIDRAGVQIIERYSHSKRVPYVPPGRDATVSWYGPDFAFKNNLNQPILIRSRTIYGRIIIEIFSSDIVEYAPREIPNASDRLPKEINTQ